MDIWVVILQLLFNLSLGKRFGGYKKRNAFVGNLEKGKGPVGKTLVKNRKPSQYY